MGVVKIHSSSGVGVVTSTTPTTVQITSGEESPPLTTNTVHITTESQQQQQQQQHQQTIQIQQQPQTIQITQSPNQSLANAQVCLDSVQLTDVDVRTNSKILLLMAWNECRVPYVHWIATFVSITASYPSALFH